MQSINPLGSIVNPVSYTEQVLVNKREAARQTASLLLYIY